MLKKAMIFFTTTMMMLIFTIGTTAVTATSTSNKSDIEAETFFKACDLNEDGTLNVCDLLIAKRTKNSSFVSAISKFLTKKPLDYAKDLPVDIGPAINLTDLRICNDVVLSDVMSKIESSNETVLSRENDGSVRMVCHFDTSDECYLMDTISLEEARKTDAKKTAFYERNDISVNFLQKDNGIIYFVVPDNTTFPVELKWNKLDTTTTIRISDAQGRISEPITIDYSKPGRSKITIKIDNDVYEAMLIVSNNSYEIRALPSGFHIVK
jgi:hypothetical protein